MSYGEMLIVRVRFDLTKADEELGVHPFRTEAQDICRAGLLLCEYAPEETHLDISTLTRWAIMGIGDC